MPDAEQQELEPRIDSSLLFTRTDDTQNFIHDNIRDFFLAFYFISYGITPPDDLIPNERFKEIILMYGQLIPDALGYVQHLVGNHFEEQDKYRTIFPNQRADLAISIVQDRPENDPARNLIIDDLIGILKREQHIDCDDKSLAAQHLADICYDKTIGELIAFLGSDHPKRHWAISVLGRKKARKAIPAIMHYASDPDNIAYFWASQGIFLILGDESVPYLIQFVKSQQRPLSHLALRNICYIKGFDPYPLIQDIGASISDEDLQAMFLELRYSSPIEEKNKLAFHPALTTIKDIAKKVSHPYHIEVLNMDIVQ